MTIFPEQINYNYWANLTLIQAASKLGPNAFDQKIVGSWLSVHETLIHILCA